MVNPPDRPTRLQEEHEYSSIRSSEQDDVRDLLNFPVRSPEGEVMGILDPFETSGYPPVLLISFVAEWCEHCNYEAPFLSELYQTWGNRGWVWLRYLNIPIRVPLPNSWSVMVSPCPITWGSYRASSRISGKPLPTIN